MWLTRTLVEDGWIGIVRNQLDDLRCMKYTVPLKPFLNTCACIFLYVRVCVCTDVYACVHMLSALSMSTDTSFLTHTEMTQIAATVNLMP